MEALSDLRYSVTKSVVVSRRRVSAVVSVFAVLAVTVYRCLFGQVERVTALLADAGDACPDAAALSARVSSLPTADAPLRDTLRRAAEAAVAEHESAAVAQLRATYAEWERRRLEALEEQREAEERASRIQALEEKRQEIRERERLLWFFDKEEQLVAEVDRQWNRPPPFKPPHVQKLLRKKRPAQADYVPPSVQRTHNP